MSVCFKEPNISEAWKFQRSRRPFYESSEWHGSCFLSFSPPIPLLLSFFSLLPSTSIQKSGDRSHTILSSLWRVKGGSVWGAGLRDGSVIIPIQCQIFFPFVPWLWLFFFVLICNQQATSDPDFLCILAVQEASVEQTHAHTEGKRCCIKIKYLQFLFTCHTWLFWNGAFDLTRRSELGIQFFSSDKACVTSATSYPVNIARDHDFMTCLLSQNGVLYSQCSSFNQLQCRWWLIRSKYNYKHLQSGEVMVFPDAEDAFLMFRVEIPSCYML